MGCPLPTEEGVWGGGCAPPQHFFNFLVQCAKKNCVQAKGASPSAPPLNTPLDGVAYWCGHQNSSMFGRSSLYIPTTVKHVVAE